MDAIFSSANFWVLISFILLFGLFGKRVYGTLIQAIDERTHKISAQLEEAQRLQNEAEKLLATYKRKHAEAMEQSVKIVSHAEQEAIELKRASERDLKRFIELKEKAMEERIALSREETIHALRQEVLRDAFRVVESLLGQDTQEQKDFAERALTEISKVSLKKVS